MENIQKSLGKDSGWIIDSVIYHAISISKYNPLAGISYIKLPKELNYPRKGLINIQDTDDNECFKWCLVLKSDCHLPKKIIFTCFNESPLTLKPPGGGQFNPLWFFKNCIL